MDAIPDGDGEEEYYHSVTNPPRREKFLPPLSLDDREVFCLLGYKGPRDQSINICSVLEFLKSLTEGSTRQKLLIDETFSLTSVVSAVLSSGEDRTEEFVVEDIVSIGS